MKNRVLPLLLSLVLIVSLFPMSAGAENPGGSCGENLTWHFNESTGRLTISGSGKMADYGYFGCAWSDYIDRITSVCFPEGLTTIGRYAFYRAENLKELTLPNSLCIISESAFSDCPIEKISFGSGLQLIEAYAFENLKVKNLVLPEGLVSIETLAGDGVETLSIPSSLVEIGMYGTPLLTLPSLKSVTASASNPVFTAESGILYSKDKTRVVLYPSASGKTLKLADTVTDISGISGCESITELTLPAVFTDYSTLRISELFPNVEIIHVPDTVRCLDFAFYGCKKLKTVNIPSGISSLHETFAACESLETVEIPSSVLMMEGTFRDCTSLKNVIIPSNVKTIDNCFYGCKSLEHITIPGSVETMYHAFYESGLSEVTLCEGIKVIDDSAFSQCNLTELTIPDSVTVLGENAFYRNPLQKIHFGSGLQTIGESCFYGCSDLRELHLPQSLTYIGDAAFYGANWLTDVTMGDNIEFIGRSCFNARNIGQWDENNCAQYIGQYLIFAIAGDFGSDEELGEGKHNNHLIVREGTKLIASGAINSYYEVILPQSMTVIQEYTFSDCGVQIVRLPSTLREIRRDAFSNSALKQIDLPESLERIEQRAFLGCRELHNVSLPKNLSYLGNAAFSKSGYYNDLKNWSSGFLYLDQALLATDDQVVKDEVVTVKPGTKLICGYALSDLQMRTAKLPDVVTMLGYGAFSGCKNLSEISLPESISMIEGEAFYECECLRELTLPKGLKSLGERCFQYSGIRTLSIPAGITELPEELFKFSPLRSITVPDTVTKLNDDVFWGCRALTQVTLPKNITDIPRYTFYGVGISELSIPNGVRSIGESAFKASSIQKLDLPSAVTCLGENAFAGCDLLTQIHLSENLQTISEDAFINCDRLKSLTIPASVQYVAAHAFGYTYSEADGYVLRDDVCIYGTAGTEAERYAIANSIPFNQSPTAKQTVYNATAVSTKTASVAVDKTSVAVGEAVSVRVTPKSGYAVYRLALGNAIGGSELQYSEADNANTFRMPESNVFASAILLPVDSGHSHEYLYIMYADASSHWRQCACGSITDKDAHQFEWVTDAYPSAQYEGCKHEECSVCGYKRNLNTTIPTQADPPHTHDWYMVSNLWQHWQSCDCGELTQAQAHTYVWVIDYYATKDEAGWKHRECSICGFEPNTGEEIPPITDSHVHEYVSSWAYDDDQHWHECGCGAKTATAAHSFEWVIDDPATKEQAGMKHRKCTVCNCCKDWTEIPKLTDDHTHSYYISMTVQPTCTTAGHTLYMCSCSASYTTPIAALGHSYVNGTCIRCGAADPNYNPADPCNAYSDINRGAWYHSAADFVISRGLMGSTKTDSYTFEPNTKVSRAMVASILYRMAGSPAAFYKATFTDVPNGKWFTTAIEWCAQNGLASGKGNGKYDPNGNVTRQELAVFMMKMAEYLGKDTSGRADLGSFVDAAKVPSWAKAYVAWAVDAGLISGKASGGKTYLAPTDNATRAEFASIIMRFVQNIAEA